MEQEPVAAAAPRYRAFVSYCHRDDRLATWIHRKLEASRLPDGTRLVPLFIDRAELAAGPDLSAQVRDALTESAALLVIASPAAKASRWVGQEIALFRQLHPDRPVLAALIEGEPDEAFPDALLQHQGTALEPLAADFRKGQDGKRLGLLKIVAGLSDQPLDRLVQRDAQARQRRVMAVTAGAVFLSLILAGLLVLALRARAEAERQRAEAEGLVEFMLTDLRDKLKGVGRLDVMDAVNQRVMERYQSDFGYRSLGSEEIIRRARLLHAMAEDDYSNTGRPNELGSRIEQGLKKSRQAWQMTNAIFARQPQNLDAIFAHSQSEFFLGYGHYLNRVNAQQANYPETYKHFNNYRGLVRMLVDLQPDNDKWQKELAYADGTLCSLILEDHGDSGKALKFCGSARAAMEALYKRKPDLFSALDFANRLSWEAEALFSNDQPERALALRKRQISIVAALQNSFPEDTRPWEARMLAELSLADDLAKQGQWKAAGLAAGESRAAADRLRGKDPANRYWRVWEKQIDEIEIRIAKRELVR
ncbi:MULTISPECIES: toll/interleukin-1 receptor domain-containing protein [unclassified Novosphingobium]|uniref:toll/interleukin-1 receptor domain-containing protein n=1 Tax=unclassified Novosphingobium TaxID=2644732 RepID=UPI000ED33673|nr:MULTISPECIES: toll/interleukin-1 receptor domain-containing protein [unclassified Novosphingobium]HCF24386.1 hypothetical protein [Novosphingobium sp.]HQV03767.1 toll/interleukin-1 receptor domain-containing protein [Novosphingobium sp.]